MTPEGRQGLGFGTARSGAALRITPDLADPVDPLEVGEQAHRTTHHGQGDRSVAGKLVQVGATKYRKGDDHGRT